MTILELLEKQAEISPNEISIKAPGQIPLTSGELIKQIKSTIAFLVGVGVSKNDTVSIVLPNGAEMAVTFLSVASCAVSAPLNPTYKEKDFEFYLADLNPKAIILLEGIDTPARTVAKRKNIRIINIVIDPAAKAGVFSMICEETHSSGTNCDLPNEDSKSLILHTSGTTSRPKIVPLTQKNITRSAMNIAATLNLDKNDCCMNVMPLFHIHGLIAALTATLISGGKIYCCPGFNEAKFFVWMAEANPTWYTAVPTMHQSILVKAAANLQLLKTLKLRFIRSSSASLPPRVMEQLERTFNTPVVEAYGMTEASHQMTSNPLPPKVRKAGSVGLAAGLKVAILDDAGKIGQNEQTGEIVIRGENVTLGYENNVKANEESYVNGWFRTGDQGRFDKEGYLFITGRLKEIINRGGETISPREIDEALMEHGEIEQAVAFAVPHETLGEDIAAAVVLTSASELTEQAIREFAFEQLADFKVPSQVVILDDIPKGATGKLQRIGLVEKLALFMRKDFVEPRDEHEAILSMVYTEVLNLHRIGVDDNFFTIGGDSLSAMRVISRIDTVYNSKIAAAQIFRCPTISELAAYIRSIDLQIDESVLEDILDELENISDEEVQKLVDEESSSS